MFPFGNMVTFTPGLPPDVSYWHRASCEFGELRYSGCTYREPSPGRTIL